ncbi:MAG: MBL fold metallo-hydrolase [Firmicutes bacterium]|nr:MBL fold metallo-hydrolase [Bacillota bacterium]
MLRVIHHRHVIQFKMSRTIPGGGRFTTSAFLFDGLLIDTGGIYCREEFMQALRRFPPQLVVNTHYHEDHIGNNKPIQDEWGIPIYAHPMALPIISEPSTRLGMEWFRQLVWRVPDGSEVLPLGGELITPHYRLQVIHTGGHTPDHICLYEPQHQYLFSGDLFLGERVKHSYLYEDINQILAAWRQLSRLPVKEIYCALLGRVPNGQQAILNKIAYWEELKSAAQKYQQLGYSRRKIRRLLLGKEGLRSYLTQGRYSKQNLFDSLMGLGPTNGMGGLT